MLQSATSTQTVRCLTQRRPYFRGLFGSTKRSNSEPVKVTGTAPTHRACFFLSSPTPPSQFPSRHTTPLQRALQLKFVKQGALVNLAWDTSASATSISEEKTKLTTFGSQGRLEIPEISLENVDEFDSVLQGQIEGSLSPHQEEKESLDSGTVDVYICTHGARDCRCGDTGGALLKALTTLYRERARQGDLERQIRIHEVAHVGGHHLAANVLVYPQGEWFGLLTEADAPQLLDTILRSASRPFTSDDPPLLPEHWRGRRGFSKDEQAELFEKHASSV